MGNKLSAFLHPELVGEKEVIISKRFRDEEGNVIPFKIRAISQEENDALIKKCTVTKSDRSGSMRRELDSLKYQRSLIVAGTVFPDLADAQLCEAYGVLDPLMVAPKMLLTGEYQLLGDAIAELSGMGMSVDDEAKNL